MSGPIDLPTWFYLWGWRGWVAAFLLLETLAILDEKSGDTLTEQIRPLFHTHPLTWFLAAGFAGWLVMHFLFPAAERWLAGLSEPWRVQ